MSTTRRRRKATHRRYRTGKVLSYSGWCTIDTRWTHRDYGQRAWPMANLNVPVGHTFGDRTSARTQTREFNDYYERTGLTPPGAGQDPTTTT